MNITILNGNPPDHSSQFDKYLHNLGNILIYKSFDLTKINLRDQKINFCIGCWDCWTKTPGRCALNDDLQSVYPAMINCDLLIFASPLIAGFPSSIIKKVNDRMVPFVLPYIKIIQNECHHKKRYPEYPKLALILEKENDTKQEDLDIVKDIYKRLAINFHSELAFFKTTEEKKEEIVHEINNIQRITTA
jgi:multimeric flavodoxin WrbA